MQGLLTRGPAYRGEPHAPSDPPSAIDLFHGTTMTPDRRQVAVSPDDIEIVVAPEWLTDLHDPTLVITPGYVGAERRRIDRGTPGSAPPTGRARRNRWAKQIAKLVCMTLVVAVPLTLVAGRSVSASTGTPPAATKTPSKSSGGPGHHRARRSTASSHRAARAEAASRRAIGRQQSSVNPVGSPSATRAPHIARSTDGSAVAQQQAAQAAAALSHQQEAQVRALNQAAATQRRTQVRAARAAAQAAGSGAARRHPASASSATVPGT